MEAGPTLVHIFKSYLAQDNAFENLIIWRDISARFEDLRRHLPDSESAASYFPEGVWEATLQDKERRGEAFWQAWDAVAED